MDKSEFWNNIILATEAEPRDVTSLCGASGFSHPITALGVDEKRRRVVVISGESDARTTALAQSDIQAAIPSTKVVIARPAPLNLSIAAQLFSQTLGTTKIGSEHFEWMNANEAAFKEKISDSLTKASNFCAKSIFGEDAAMRLNVLAFAKELIQQLALLEMDLKPGADGKEVTFDVSKLQMLDPVEADRNMGVCSIPLYNFTEDEAETLKSKLDVEYTKALLEEHDILQYFFPPADQLALGLVEHNKYPLDYLIDNIKKVPSEGHPFGNQEILDQNLQLESLIQELIELGLLVEGDIGVEITEEGIITRNNIKFKPREALLTKLSKVFSLQVNLDLSLKDLFK